MESKVKGDQNLKLFQMAKIKKSTCSVWTDMKKEVSMVTSSTDLPSRFKGQRSSKFENTENGKNNNVDMLGTCRLVYFLCQSHLRSKVTVSYAFKQLVRPCRPIYVVFSEHSNCLV